MKVLSDKEIRRHKALFPSVRMICRKSIRQNGSDAYNASVIFSDILSI